MMAFLFFFRRKHPVIAKCLPQISVITSRNRHFRPLEFHKYCSLKPLFFIFLFHIIRSRTQLCDILAFSNRILRHFLFCQLPDSVSHSLSPKNAKQKPASHGGLFVFPVMQNPLGYTAAIMPPCFSGTVCARNSEYTSAHMHWIFRCHFPFG